LKIQVDGYQSSMHQEPHTHADVESTLKKAAAALKGAKVPFLLGGSLACWVRGGPQPFKDVDLMVKKEDVHRALDALVQAGMRPEDPPEDWLVKAWDGDLLVDLIHGPVGLPITDEVLARGDELNVFSIRMSVMAPEDVISTKLLALSEHVLDYEHLLQIARCLREQVDWNEVRQRTGGSPYARAFFALLDELDVLPAAGAAGTAGKSAAEAAPGRRIRVVDSP
jgi:hypothetical protein